MPSTQEAACIERLVALRDTSNRARLLALMPTIDALARQGVPQKDIVSTLNAEGIAITPAAFQSTLYRWRKRNAQAHPRHTPKAPAPGPASSAAIARTAPPAITNKAQLKLLREGSDLDLEHLARLGRKPQE